MGHVQKTLAEMLGAIARTNADPVVRHFARLTVSGMSRGGGDSEQIRLEILNILRRNGIREGHRPGEWLGGAGRQLRGNAETTRTPSGQGRPGEASDSRATQCS